jgi:hypothetical protein
MSHLNISKWAVEYTGSLAGKFLEDSIPLHRRRLCVNYNQFNIFRKRLDLLYTCTYKFVGLHAESERVGISYPVLIKQNHF